MEVVKLLTGYAVHLAFVGGCALGKSEAFSHRSNAIIGVAAAGVAVASDFVVTKLLPENFMTKDPSMPWVIRLMGMAMGMLASEQVAQRCAENNPREDVITAEHAARLVRGALAVGVLEVAKYGYSYFCAKKG